MARPKVAVLMGGPSAEREVSLASGLACARALREGGLYDVTGIDAGPDVVARLQAAGPDVVLNCLHGRWGEDGCAQGLLEWLGIPYTHSGVLASALAMDKARSKKVYETLGLPIAPGRIVRKDEVEAGHVMAPPYVIKPNNEGSSVGVYLVHAGDVPPQLNAQMPAEVMAETFVPGRELTCAVIGGRALTVTDIVTAGWYDYDAKYSHGGSDHVVPAQIPERIFDLCMQYARAAHEGLGCRGVSRTDFRWDERRGADGLIVLETNTQPGMTRTSLVPEQAEACGIEFDALCRWMIEDASCDR